eukprot:scaffold28835_cov63-Phaeocystis_antarctica.AAC.2
MQLRRAAFAPLGVLEQQLRRMPKLQRVALYGKERAPHRACTCTRRPPLLVAVRTPSQRARWLPTASRGAAASRWPPTQPALEACLCACSAGGQRIAAPAMPASLVPAGCCCRCCCSRAQCRAAAAAAAAHAPLAATRRCRRTI